MPSVPACNPASKRDNAFPMTESIPEQFQGPLNKQRQELLDQQGHLIKNALRQLLLDPKQENISHATLVQKADLQTRLYYYSLAHELGGERVNEEYMID